MSYRFNLNNNIDPLNLNRFTIDDTSHIPTVTHHILYKQKNLLEKLLNNLNNGIMRHILSKINVIDRNNRIYIAGGKALNDYLPLTYNTTNPIEKNIISFDFDLHISSFSTTNPISNNNLLEKMNFYLTHLTDWDVLKFNTFLNNLYKIFNEHPDNNILLHDGTNLRVIEIDTTSNDRVIRFFAVSMGGVYRIAIPIKYYCNSVTYDKYFAFADISTDESFPMLNDLIMLPKDILRGFNLELDEDLDEDFKNIIEDTTNNDFKLNLRHTNGNINTLFNYPIIENDNNYTIPLYCVILNIIFYGYKKNYILAKRTKNKNKVLKLLHHLENNDLNPRVYDNIMLPTQLGLGTSKPHMLHKLYTNQSDNQYKNIKITNGIISLSNENNTRNEQIHGEINKTVKFLKSVNTIYNAIQNYNYPLYDKLFEDNYKFDNEILKLNNLITKFNMNQYIKDLLKVSNNIILYSVNEPCSNFYDIYPIINKLVMDFPKLLNIESGDPIINNGLISKQTLGLDMSNAIKYWRSNGYKAINKYLLTNTADEIVKTHERNLSKSFNHIQRIDDNVMNMYQNSNNDIYKVQERLNYILENQQFKEYTTTISNPSWILTYRVSRYYNISNMQVSDNESMEFYIGQNISDGLYKSTSLSNHMNFSAFYDIEDPCYVFEFVINSKDTHQFIIIENENQQECELLLNKNLNIKVFDISVKNIMTYQNNKMIVRNKYVISCIVLEKYDTEPTLLPNTFYALDDLYKDNKGFNTYQNMFALNERLPCGVEQKIIYQNNIIPNIIISNTIISNITDIDIDSDMTKRDYDMKKRDYDTPQDDTLKTKYLKYKNKYLKLKTKLNM